MPDLKQFRLPDVGEGLTEADILSWSVAPGDRVVVNQTLVEVETAKAAVELPSQLTVSRLVELATFNDVTSAATMTPAMMPLKTRATSSSTGVKPPSARGRVTARELPALELLPQVHGV